MGGSTAVANSQDMAISHVAATGRGTDTGALRHLDNTPGNRLRRKNQVGQPLSHRGWQDGGVKVTNGVLELWSKGVMEARDAQPFCDAGPEAGVPTQPRKRSEVGKGGKEAGKWTGFSRLFPHNSTQVVDFPRMSVVSIFLKDEKQLNLVRGIPSGAWNQDGEAMRNRQGRRAGGRSRGFSGGAEPRHARARVLPEQTERSLMFA